MVSSGSGSNSRSMLAISVSKSPPGKSVRPIDPANSTSPLKTTPCPTKQTLPGECPGAWRTSKLRPPTFSCSLATRSRSGSGLLLGRGETEPCRLLRNTVIQRAVSRMQPHDRPRLTRDFRHAEHVIDVRVSEPDGHGLRCRLLDLMENQARFLAGIDDGALVRL